MANRFSGVLPGLGIFALSLLTGGIGGLAFGSGAVVQASAALGSAGILSAGIGLIAGSLFRESGSDLDTDAASPAYSFNQWNNPRKGDSPVSVIYSKDGHKHAPTYIAATLAPKGAAGNDWPKALRQEGQAMSALLAIGEGPIKAITDIRVNDEPLLEEFTETFTGNGTKKKFKLGKKRVELDTLQVTEGATDRGYTLTEQTIALPTGTGAVLVREVALPDNVATEYSPVIKVNGTEIDVHDETALRPHIWLSDRNTLWLNSQTAVPSGTRITVTVKTRVMTGVTPSTKDKETTLTFATAPSSGTKIVVTGLRRLFRGVRIDKRFGGFHQLNIPGFSDLRNTYGDGTAIGKDGNEVTITTRDEVDDVVLNIASGGAGFTSFDKEGNRNRTYAHFRVEYRRADDNGAFTGTWTTLLDPAGKKSAKQSASGVKKNAGEFEVRGDSISQLFWSFSLRNILERLVADFPKVSAHRDRLRRFTRGRYEIRVTRTSSIKGNTNTRFLDDIILSSYEEVIDEFIGFGGTAMLAVHAIASSRVQGGAPRVTCKVSGIPTVEKYDGSAWVIDEDAQSNPVWAACDLVTARRYGGGEQYTKANIDTTSALAAANYCDELVSLPGGGTESRARLDVPLDARRGLLATVADMLRPAGIWPVLQGDTWKFVIDQAVDLAAVPVLWEDTAARRTTDGEFSHGSIAQQPTEIQVAFLDEARDHDRKEVWVTPGTPSDSRRIQRVQAFGVTRRTQTTRYANRTFTQMTAGALYLRLRTTMKHLGMEAGDVFRYRSTRLGIDAYWRIYRAAVDSSDYGPKFEAIPYVPAVYGQQEAPQSTDTSSVRVESPRTIYGVVSHPPTPTGASRPPVPPRRRVRMPARARRVA